ncbi:MAG: hypothetical protein J6P45_08855 [Lachnospiraceae bacterium]|nr:hypothetical protein [Lachnospiraceae bacterium]
MISKKPIKKYLPFIIALVHTCLSFFTDRLVFTVSPLDSLHNYIPCKLLMLLFLYLFWRFIISGDRQILKYSAIYMIPVTAVLAFKLPQGFLTNDETQIFQMASQLADYKWFYYLTTWYYIICLMMIPVALGPVIVKVILQVLLCGYCVKRFGDYMKSKKTGAFMYVAFLLPPILAYTTSAHRIPVYIFLYLFLLFKMLMDRLEDKSPSKPELLALLVLIAVLTQWRTEGIYLALSGPALLFISYPSVWKNKRSVLFICLASLFIQYLTAVPQYGFIPRRMNDQAANRMSPFYAYTVTNMFRNGLDLEKNAGDISQIDRYIDVDTIMAINKDLGDINYEDVLILYYEGYTGLSREATDEDYLAFVKASQNLMLNNPAVLLKTKIGSFDYAATVYDIRLEESGIKGLAKLFVSIVKTLAYNLYAPMLLLLMLFIYSLIKIKRRPYTFLMTLGLFAHWFIVFVLAPASYFKYYFPVYFTVYSWYVMIAACFIYNKRHEDKRNIII